MADILAQIIAAKTQQVADRKRDYPASRKSFKQALAGESLAIIAEFKRRSPCAGDLVQAQYPFAIVKQYIDGGADALSILTDGNFFGGSLDDLSQLAQACSNNPTPILRKDFIIDPLQVLESYIAGANAILLIVAVLQEKTQSLLALAQALGLDVLVEVHNQAELDIALSAGADIIGINNRNLKDFTESLDTCLSLVEHIPADVIKVAESSVHSAEDMLALKQAGFDAVLIGTALLRAEDRKAKLADLRRLL